MSIISSERIQDAISKKAMFRASDLFHQRIFNYEPLRSSEEIEQLARAETKTFSRSGRVLFVLKPAWFLSEQKVTETYYTTFLNIYQDSTRKMQEPEPDLQ